ncbi:Membrane protein insertase YidC [Frankliniella fusca]|uniref:Membrane protein insertase YidC n=1 Tax=Frankliniella fusca TaxID=407009 RepID=A0AAE1HT47_9NEOP|nr:Membrane protein insertase YidC [Frankliniella fusca]
MYKNKSSSNVEVTTYLFRINIDSLLFSEAGQAACKTRMRMEQSEVIQHKTLQVREKYANNIKGKKKESETKP